MLLVGLKRECHMRTTPNYITPLLAAGAVAVAIATAPTALAAPTGAVNPPQAQESCIDLGTDTQCQSPGNVQINDSPGYPQYPYFYYPFYGGDFDFDHGLHGGFGGGGGRR
jgi:hypothetical protein